MTETTETHDGQTTGRKMRHRARHKHATASANDGAATQPTSEATPEPATLRAEQLMDEWGRRLGAFASNAEYQVRKLAARTREEAEDIWAEAQSVAHGNGAQPVRLAKIEKIEDITPSDEPAASAAEQTAEGQPTP